MAASSIEDVVEMRRRGPAAIEEAARARIRPPRLGSGSDRLLVIAADHPARGALGAGRKSMGDRFDLLERLVLALSRPHVNGVLGTADVLEDLLLLGALDEKYVFGSMNRGGLFGASFEIDDRFTAHDASWIEKRGFDGGKMLLRIDLHDLATPAMLESCGRAVGELAALGLQAMVEPFLSRHEEGNVRNILEPEAAIRALAIASGLGPTSAHTWLKVPIVPELDRVMRASTLPALILGGEVSDDQEATFESWRQALALPTVMGLVVGRSLLFPPGDDVVATVDAAGALVAGAR